MNTSLYPVASSVSLAKVVSVSDFVYHVNECGQCKIADKHSLLCTLGRSLDVALTRTMINVLTCSFCGETAHQGPCSLHLDKADFTF